MLGTRTSRRPTALLTPWVGALILATMLTACEDAERRDAPTAPDSPHFTMGSGSVSTLLGRGTFDGFQVRRVVGERSRHGLPDDRWRVEVKAQPDLDIAVQRITFEPGGQSGWHRHPGPVFIQVLSGEMTFYEEGDPNCTPIVRSAGQGYLDTGIHAHIARNETGQPAENLVIYFAPPGAALRIDAPDPGNCPF